MNRKQHKKKASIALGSIMLMLSGCSILSPIPNTEINNFQIVFTPPNTETTTQSETKLPKQNLTLFVTPLSTEQPYNSTDMYYQQEKYILASYQLSRWATLPSKMITQTLIRSLETQHIFENVVSSNFIGYANYRLTGTLNKLVQVVDKNGAKVLLSVSYTLVSADNGRVIASKNFTLSTPSETNAKSYAKTTNLLANKLANNVSTWLLEASVKTQTKKSALST